ncbi:MBL fold metallo-hydrolase [Streptomyces sp. N2-109]|uniref:MBL fold metallo-hydrolase n=1 Tax=Streptomyces gossypii TaxID=2883101 RepID=A0ABT2K379_9ACTN|nr:MBL fold metallo-hydrolase [Streptomyces gossypii]MCT2594632.1 MBL fold metallo-hydrolase [Streptomyces gossypii]
MELTVLGGCGAWPTADQACSGYVVESDGFRLLIDPGYATLPRLLAEFTAAQVDAVLVSHGHPDHCADLNPLLRARALADTPAPALPLYALPGALDAVLALDRPGMLAGAYELREFEAGTGRRFGIGPFTVDTRLLPHFVPNAGVRLTASDGTALVYTGDTGPSPEIAALARDAELLLSEATYPEQVPAADAAFLLSARLAGGYATAAGAGRLVLTHLWPDSDAGEAVTAAAAAYDGPVSVASPGARFTTGP